MRPAFLSEEERVSRGRARCARYYRENRDKMSARNKEYHYANRDAILARHKVVRKKNWPARLEYVRNKRKTEPAFRLSENLRRRVNDVVKRGTKLARTFELVGCPISELRVHLESLFRPGMTWENYGPVWHIDHKRPCSSFNLLLLDEQKICFHWTNLQPLFAEENLRKSDKYAPSN